MPRMQKNSLLIGMIAFDPKPNHWYPDSAPKSSHCQISTLLVAKGRMRAGAAKFRRSLA
jgi:hypothetical protein